VPDQPQHHAEARLGEQPAVLGIRNLPYFAEDIGGDLGALEEGDGALAGYDAELVAVGLREEEGEGAFLVG